MEPTIFLWGKDLPNFYNWTMSYRNDCTIHMPYGKFFKLSMEERQARTKNVFDSFKKKTQMAAALISNCYDQAYRYKIIGELRRYGVDISVYGKCGSGEICFSDQDKKYQCMEDFLKTFKFYFALENSHCRDYITEKFWMVFSRDQIPVVAWRQHLKNYAPPGSFINLFDFPSFKEAADYLLEVANNESLYNSFFKWKYEYKVGGDLCNFCKICKTLHTPLPAQVYSDFDGWVKDDTCKKTSIKTLISSYIHRKLYDIGLVS
ncbi:hypothetical protein ACJMK2_033647 [Sinanodonta woodiana]|uniref:Fucosyltransferase n=1 Tax=Sinanodonta woodiana TaxID=1069815 RepID=A0ABD3WSJ4_SINWO